MRRRIAGLMPGQNAQKKGMGFDAYHACDESKTVFEIGCEATELDLKHFCWELEDAEMTGPVVQPALAAAYLSDLAWKKQRGFKPYEYVPQSVSEIIALGAANSFDLKDMFKILQVRGDAMDEAQKNVPSILTAYPGLFREELQWAIDYARRKLGKLGKPLVARAMNNSLTVHVAGGDPESIAFLSEVTDLLYRLGRVARHRPRNVKDDGASHTDYMAEAVPQVFEAIAAVPKRVPDTPVIANNGEYFTNPDLFAGYLSNAIQVPADMHLSTWVVLARGVRHFMEIDGSGKGLLTAQLERDFPDHRINQTAFGKVVQIKSLPEIPYDIKHQVLKLAV